MDPEAMELFYIQKVGKYTLRFTAPPRIHLSTVGWVIADRWVLFTPETQSLSGAKAHAREVDNGIWKKALQCVGECVHL